MPTDVVMPQMGESIAEGTIVRWIKNVGDSVARDEPLFEISTDKVDAEIPSPAAGVVAEIRANAGETVPVNSVVAVIEQPEERPAAASKPAAAPVALAAPVAPTPVQPPTTEAAPASAPPADENFESRIRRRSSPLVRKIAQDRHVDISKIPGTGIAGRVTKRDILDFLEHDGGGSAPAPSQPRTPERPPAAPLGTGAPGDVQPMSVMRKRIAEHMIASRRTSAHVHSVFEVSFARVAQAREARKAEFEKAGAKLTYLSFIVKAVTDALLAVPVVNASIDGDNVVYHREVNIGVAVALDWGLIVPVIKKADERNLLGISRAVADLAARARAKQLKPEEVTGGTFTITNPGVFGALFGMPIINQPQVAILGVGAIEKRPVVIDDAIAIRPMAYLSLGYDHRLIDGAVADQFLSHVKHNLENWDPANS
jgi:2-oxoglutarate dehydrogenase E2 component (dihydrolipoamide succinyltransferase)